MHTTKHFVCHRILQCETLVLQLRLHSVWQAGRSYLATAAAAFPFYLILPILQAKAGGHYDYSYNGLDWPGSFPQCRGKKQSPVMLPGTGAAGRVCRLCIANAVHLQCCGTEALGCCKQCIYHLLQLGTVQWQEAVACDAAWHWRSR